jgi:hypothetical protein
MLSSQRRESRRERITTPIPSPSIRGAWTTARARRFTSGEWLRVPRRVNLVRWRTFSMATGKKAASAASKTLSNKKEDKGAKTAAGSDLAQTKKPSSKKK